jgi:hypothetical protein
VVVRQLWELFRWMVPVTSLISSDIEIANKGATCRDGKRQDDIRKKL